MKCHVPTQNMLGTNLGKVGITPCRDYHMLPSITSMAQVQHIFPHIKFWYKLDVPLGSVRGNVNLHVSLLVTGL